MFFVTRMKDCSKDEEARIGRLPSSAASHNSVSSEVVYSNMPEKRTSFQQEKAADGPKAPAEDTYQGIGQSGAAVAAAAPTITTI